MTLIMIRHGKTKSNEERRYLGLTEEGISEAGTREILEYKIRQYYPEVDCLFTSPMKRCVQTAGLIYPDLKPVCIPEWKEMDFGAFEGKNYLDLKEDERYRKWIGSNGVLPFPEGESREQFLLRCEKGMERMIREITPGRMTVGEKTAGKTAVGETTAGKIALEEKERKTGQTVGMLVHGGTIMALLSRYGDGSYFDYQIENGRGYVCTYQEENGKAVLTDIRKL